MVSLLGSGLSLIRKFLDRPKKKKADNISFVAPATALLTCSIYKNRLSPHLNATLQLHPHYGWVVIIPMLLG